MAPASSSANHDAWRVLSVDDETIDLRLMRDRFRVVFGREGQVVTVDSGEDALIALEQGDFDVVVADQACRARHRLLGSSADAMARVGVRDPHR